MNSICFELYFTRDSCLRLGVTEVCVRERDFDPGALGEGAGSPKRLVPLCHLGEAAPSPNPTHTQLLKHATAAIPLHNFSVQHTTVKSILN
jgi:hypothetical protein